MIGDDLSIELVGSRGIQTLFRFMRLQDNLKECHFFSLLQLWIVDDVKGLVEDPDDVRFWRIGEVRQKIITKITNLDNPSVLELNQNLCVYPTNNFVESSEILNIFNTTETDHVL